MTDQCPVCGDPVEYREVVTLEDGSGVAGRKIDVEALCAMDDGTRWNRICPVASEAEGSVQLEVYRHHWESTE